MPPPPVRVGFVGTGGIARSHIRRLTQIPEARIVALCDIDAARVQEVAGPLGAAVYTDAAKLIAEAPLDALYVCVPPHAHGDIEVRAAEKGLHLFVEKPVNLYMEDARRAAQAIEKAGVLSQSGYSLRYLASAEQLRELLSHHQVGSAHAFRWSGLPKTPWWQRYDQGGGQLVEMTTHSVDLLRYVMGEVAAVSASYSFNRLFKDEPGVTVPDTQAALLIFESGASATVTTSCAVTQGGLNDIHFALKDARVYWKGDSVQVFPEGKIPLPPAPSELPSVDAAFIRAIYSGSPSLLKSPYNDALKSAAVTLACNRSAEEGGRLIGMKEFLG